jgi:hypothetical protein
MTILTQNLLQNTILPLFTIKNEDYSPAIQEGIALAKKQK